MTAAESIARAFHAHYERLAPRFGYKTREASAVPWEDVPAQNRDLMVAVVENLLDTRVIVRGPRDLSWQEPPISDSQSGQSDGWAYGATTLALLLAFGIAAFRVYVQGRRWSQSGRS